MLPITRASILRAECQSPQSICNLSLLSTRSDHVITYILNGAANRPRTEIRHLGITILLDFLVLGKLTARNLSCKARLYAVELHPRPRFNIGATITGIWDAIAAFWVCSLTQSTCFRPYGYCLAHIYPSDGRNV